MTNEPTLADAIKLIRHTTPKHAPWSGDDLSDDPRHTTDTDDAIARILNAVVAGELAPPATECPFGDDCDLTVAYMAGAASKKTASIVSASQLADDDKDATIARLEAKIVTMAMHDKVSANVISQLSCNVDAAENRAERAEAKLAEVTEERATEKRRGDRWMEDAEALKAKLTESKLDLDWMTGSRDTWQDAAAIRVTRAEKAEAALARARDAAFREGIEAAVNAIQSFINAYTARKDLDGTLRVVRDAVSRLAPQADLETCPDCEGTGIGGHPDSGNTCAKCDGCGGVQADPVREAATEKMVDAAFKALPPDAHGTIGAGEMYRVIEAALAQKGPSHG